MEKDELFLHLLKDSKKTFKGWDFSFISRTGRIQSELLSWSYGSLVYPLMRKAHSVLDMGTGGGEFLSMLQPFPEKLVATEAYKPNVPVAKERLEPLGVKVVALEDEEKLPFEDKQFDTVLNRHQYYSPSELRRIMVDEGIFVTQQVGGLDCSSINQMLGSELNHEYINWKLETAIKELKDNSFVVEFQKEEFPVQRFYDLGSLVYYLQAIPWQIPDFMIEKYTNKLYAIHEYIQRNGYFDVNQHRFIVRAKAV